MSEVKRYTKKLTNSGGGVCALSFIAFLLAAAGASMDFVVTAIYNRYYYNKKDSMFASNWFEYIKTYDQSLILVFFTFAAMCCIFSSKRKRKIGSGFAALITVTSLALAAGPISMIIEKLANGELTNAVKYDNDYAKFVAVSNLIVYALPAFSSFLMLLAGIVLIGRVSSEEFTVEISTVGKNAASNNEINSDAVSAKIDITDEKKSVNNYIDPNLVKSIEEPDDNAATASAVMTESESKDESAENETVCSVCGSKITGNAKFCRNCGNKLA